MLVEDHSALPRLSKHRNQVEAITKFCHLQFTYLFLIYLAPSTSPGDLQVTVVSSTALHLSWTAPLEDRNGIIREYRVKVHEIETSQLRMYSTVNSFITVQSLHPFYTYRCAVSAFTVATGPFANFSAVMLPEDGKCSFVIVKLISRLFPTIFL